MIFRTQIFNSQEDGYSFNQFLISNARRFFGLTHNIPPSVSLWYPQIVRRTLSTWCPSKVGVCKGITFFWMCCPRLGRWDWYFLRVGYGRDNIFFYFSAWEVYMDLYSFSSLLCSFEMFQILYSWMRPKVFLNILFWNGYIAFLSLFVRSKFLKSIEGLVNLYIYDMLILVIWFRVWSLIIL